ncbi:uncharacterized protein N7483_001231 [Penicillium malachiteum]|uniref:uncharacterized protein n=1 Tax=Penicillium malachiteum TaxID=1324776 RepID=UPI002548F870|nr:uncharacterized protein N7483_001231 [Penicillium malachiteum]KAJ5736106.1 hypothetical protein N7483_001231 [Penicillium malachiteum]
MPGEVLIGRIHNECHHIFQILLDQKACHALLNFRRAASYIAACMYYLNRSRLSHVWTFMKFSSIH